MLRKYGCCIAIFSLLWLAGCSRHPTAKAQGYIEGRYIYVSTSVSGKLMRRLVDRGALVKQGQLLFVLEDRPELDAFVSASESYKQSIASRDAIAANLVNAKLTYERDKILVAKRAVQQSELDRATAEFNSTTAQLAEANAKIAEFKASASQAEWQVEKKLAYANTNAMVFDTYYEPGEYVVSAQPVLSLLAPEQIKAVFFVGENQLAYIRINDVVTVSCDGCKEPIKGNISFISPSAEYTPPVIYSEQTNEKLIYRIEAAFTPDKAIKLHPGQPVTVAYPAYER